MEGSYQGEFIEIVVDGEIVNFEHVGLAFNSNIGILEETDSIMGYIVEYARIVLTILYSMLLVEQVAITLIKV